MGSLEKEVVHQGQQVNSYQMQQPGR